MRVVMVFGAALVLAGCGHLQGHKTVPRGGETITYETTACYGTCPAYVVTLGPDGQGIFEGRAHTRVIGARRFRANPNQVRAFVKTLARIRPADGRTFGTSDMVKLCDGIGTDAPVASVRWQGAVGVTSLAFYYGCVGTRAEPFANALRAAPTLLPIADLIGSH